MDNTAVALKHENNNYVAEKLLNVLRDSYWLFRMTQKINIFPFDPPAVGIKRSICTKKKMVNFYTNMSQFVRTNSKVFLAETMFSIS